MRNLITTLTILLFGLASYAQIGNIENINVEQRDDGTGMVDIYYNLVQTGIATYNITIEASFDGGTTFSQIPEEYLSGDLEEVSEQNELHVVWDGLGSHPEIYTEEAMLKIIATKVEATVTDIEGNVYPYVEIGNQIWMAMNLKTTKYNNGDNIATGLSVEEWENATSGAYAISPHTEDSWGNPIEGIDSEEEMVDYYGILYNWHVADDSRGICPTGWTVPSNEDWQQLLNFLIDEGYANDWNSVGGVADALRSTRVEPDPHPRWDAYQWEDYEHSDAFGFNAVPSGKRNPFGGSFSGLGREVFWWSSTLYNETQIWSYRLEYSSGDLGGNPVGSNSGYSIRCIKE